MSSVVNEASRQSEHVDKNVNEVLGNVDHPDHDSVMKVLLFLALCHNIVIDKRTGKMNAASPDELALVQGAQKYGFSFEGKDPMNIITIDNKNESLKLKYELLNTLEFSSARKRMSIIVRDCETQEITLLCKGADSIITHRLNKNHATNMSVL